MFLILLCFLYTTLIAPSVILYCTLFSRAHLEYLLRKNVGQVAMKYKTTLLVNVTIHQWGPSAINFLFTSSLIWCRWNWQFTSCVLFYFSGEKGPLKKKLKPSIYNLLILLFYFNYSIVCYIRMNSELITAKEFGYLGKGVFWIYLFHPLYIPHNLNFRMIDGMGTLNIKVKEV